MSDYVSVTIKGTFPKSDVDLIADFYGGAAVEDKLAFARDAATKVLTQWLAAPAREGIEAALAEQKLVAEEELEARIAVGLTSESEEV